MQCISPLLRAAERPTRILACSVFRHFYGLFGRFSKKSTFTRPSKIVFAYNSLKLYLYVERSFSPISGCAYQDGHRRHSLHRGLSAQAGRQAVLLRWTLFPNRLREFVEALLDLLNIRRLEAHIEAILAKGLTGVPALQQPVVAHMRTRAQRATLA